MKFCVPEALPGLRFSTVAAGALAVVIMLLGGNLMAQESPGQIEKRFQPPVLPKATPEPLELKTPERPPQPEAAPVKFVLNGVTVEGSTVYQDIEFLPLYEAFLKQEISLEQVFQIADAITAKYRNDGYILTRAIVPPQRIQNGVVKLQVVEGFIDQILIQGTVRGRQKLLDAYGAKISQSRPLQAKVLERYLLLADDLPGVTARAVLNPSVRQAGASDLILFIDHKTLEGVASLDNRGTDALGPEQASVGVEINSLFRLYEQTGLRFVTTPGEIKELIYFQLTHEQQIGREGTTLNLFGNWSQTEPGDELEQLESVGNNTTVQIALTHPFIRSRGTNLSATLRFSYRDSGGETFGEETFEDRLRTIGLGVSYDFVDRWRGVNLMSLEVTRGLDILEATAPGLGRSREGGKPDFTKVTGRLLRLQKLSPGWSLLGVFTGQYAFDQLFASEEFSLGGAQFGRAYDPAELTGDQGVALLLELQFGLTIGAKYIRDFQAYAFYDVGAVWRRVPTEGRPSPQDLASAGGGVRFNLTKAISGLIEVAWPLTREVRAEGDKDPRVFFSIVLRL